MIKFGIFQNRCAPLQINFLGYPGTSGSDKIDYIIADRTVIRKKQKIFCRKDNLRLAHINQVKKID